MKVESENCTSCSDCFANETWNSHVVTQLQILLKM